jgi:hypothetical protein
MAIRDELETRLVRSLNRRVVGLNDGVTAEPWRS